MLALFFWCCLWPLPLVLVLHRIIALVVDDVHAGFIASLLLPFMLLMLVATQHTYARTLGILTRTSNVCRSRKG